MALTVLLAGGGTGGHLMPAIALAETLRAMRPDLEPVLVGAQRGVEAHVLPRYPFRYHLLPLEPIYRREWWRNLRWPAIAWRAWRTVGAVLRAERPLVVIGTGGYASGPVVWRAQRAGLPTAVQESDAFPGLATRWLARRALQVHLGFPEARARLAVGPRTEVFTLGNPIRPPEPGDPAEARRALGLDPARPCVLVFGGSQGARALNVAVAGALQHGHLKEVSLLWGTGPAQHAQFARHEAPGRIVVRGFLDPIAPAYRAADLVVARAGAMTLAELCAWGKPSILVPLPTAAADHQAHNARALAEAGAAVLLTERGLTGHSLARAIGELIADRARLAALARVARARGQPDAARQVVSRILTLVR